MHDFPPSIMMLDQCRATFTPVAIIHVDDAIYLFDLSVMNVAADHAIKTTLASIISDCLLKLEHKVYRTFDPLL